MNLAEILKKYTKDSIIKKLIEQYPEESYFAYSYEYGIGSILEQLKDSTDKKLTAYIEISISEDKQIYELSVYDKDDNEINVADIPEDELGLLEIDDEVINIIDPKLIAAIILKNYRGGFEGVQCVSISLEDLCSKDGLMNLLGGLLGIDKEEDIDSMFRDSVNKHLGEIDITNGKMIIADPSNNTIIDDNIIEIKKGKWHIDYCKELNENIDEYETIEFVVKHESEKDIDYMTFENEAFKEYEKEYLINTQSNMLSLCVLEEFKKEELIPKDYTPKHDYSTEKWYNLCCDLTLDNEDGISLINNGVVSAVLEDNGQYSAYTYTNDAGEIVAIRVVLIKL